jgi:ribosome recycling factor
MPIRLTGLSEVTRNMEQLKRALDGAVARASFDPHNPQDVERAIREIMLKVDMKMASYISAPGVPEIASQLRDEYRKAILQKAEEARKSSPS